MTTRIIALFTVFYCFVAQANTLPDFATLKTKYPDENVVVLLNKEHINIDFKNNQWNISTQITDQMMCMSDLAAKSFSDKSISYSSFEDITDIQARTLIPETKGKKVKYTPLLVKNISTNDIMLNGVFFADYKEKKFVFPAVQIGSITELSYKQNSKDPHMTSPFFFGSYYGPTLHSEYSVTVPNYVKITYKLLGQNTESISLSQEKTANSTTYTWKTTELNKSDYEADAPGGGYSEPHIIVYINNAEVDGNKTVVLENEKGLYDWYSQLCRQVNQKSDLSQLKKLVSELTANAQTDEQKTQLIYAWVQNNIKYIAFEDGLGGFVPREAADVFQKKYGDCKDMSSIIVTMLKLANVEAYMTWIGTRDRPYKYKEVPCPIVDNHMIAVAKINNNYVFLDGTGEYQPFGLPTSMIQGKQAMIGIDSVNYQIVEVPVIDAEQSQRIENATFSIDNRNLVGNGTCLLSGYRKIFVEYARMKQEANGQKNYFNEMLSKGSNKCNITLTQNNGFGKANTQAQLNYQVVIPDYVTRTNDKIYVNMNLMKPYKDASIDIKKRKLDKENEFMYHDTYNFTLEVPTGYTIEYLPPPTEFKHKLFSFNVTSKAEDSHITTTFNLHINHLILAKENFADWNKFIDALNAAYQEAIVLKKI